MTVTEPQPGSVLVERDENTDLVTTFTVKPVDTAVAAAVPEVVTAVLEEMSCLV